MFCVNCGTKNEDGAQFCVGCGATLNAASAPAAEPAPAPAPAPAAPKAPKTQQEKYRMVGMIAVAAVAVVLALVFVALFAGRGYKATTRQFIRATYSANAKKIFRLVPDKVLKEEFESNKDRREAIEDAQDSLEEMIEFYDEYFDDWKYSFKITDSEKITGDDLKDLKKEYKNKYGLKISAAREVEIDFVITYDDGDEEMENEMTIYLIKVGNSWYLDILDNGLF